MSQSSQQIKIGKRIRNARMNAKLTQLDVARKADVSVNYYSRIERGEVNQSLGTFEAILKVLKIDSSEILPF